MPESAWGEKFTVRSMASAGAINPVAAQMVVLVSFQLGDRVCQDGLLIPVVYCDDAERSAKRFHKEVDEKIMDLVKQMTRHLRRLWKRGLVKGSSREELRTPYERRRYREATREEPRGEQAAKVIWVAEGIYGPTVIHYDPYADKQWSSTIHALAKAKKFHRYVLGEKSDG
jgi:hypothetical protein